MIRKNKKVLALMAIACQLFMPLRGLAAENLSPIATVDWEETATSSTDKESSEEKMDKSEASSQTEPEAPITTENLKQEQDMQQSEITMEGQQSISDILEILTDEHVQTASDYYLLDVDGEQVNVTLRGLVTQDHSGYLTIQEPPFLPETYLIDTQDQTLDKIYMPMEYLANYAADAINMYPQVYTESPVEKFYVFVQENHEKIKDKYIKVDGKHDKVQEAYDEFQAINEVLKATTLEFLATYEKELTIDSKDDLSTITLQADIAQKYHDILMSKMNDAPELAVLQPLVDQGVEGTLTINHQTLEIGVGLLSEQADGTTKGIEYYIQPVEQTIKKPTDDQILDEAQLVELVGSNIIQEIEAFHQKVNIEDFKKAGNS